MNLFRMFCKSFYNSSFYAVLLIALCLKVNAQSEGLAGGPQWKILPATNEPEKREDCGFVELNGKFYLLGGRGILHVQEFDPKTLAWKQKGTTPFEINHFQAISYKNEIYVVGGMTGGFPHEKPLENIYIYNPEKDDWRKGAEIPKTRRRGSGGTVVFNNKIYWIGGIQDGHWEGTVSWLDEWDPATGKWQTLPDAPHARDHFSAVAINNKLYVAGGRRTSFKTKQGSELTVSEIDVFDFKNKLWQTLPVKDTLPTARAGCTVVAYDGKLVVIGGESKIQESSHHEVEAYDTRKKTWKVLPSLVTGRHDTQAVFYQNKIYIAAGSANRGGGPDQNTIEMLEVK